MILDKVPFYSNTPDDTHCFQAALRMVMKYYIPDREFSWEELDKLTGKREGLWTWIYTGILNLKNMGFTVVLIRDFDSEKFIERGGEYLKERYGEEVAQAQMKHSDIPYEQKNVNEFKTVFGDFPGQTNIDDIKKYISEGYLVICNVNAYGLRNEKGYAGHFVVVYGFDKDSIYLHDPGLPPDRGRKISVNQFRKAWEYPDERSRNIIALKL